MILCDAGPIVAIVDQRQPMSATCRALFHHLPRLLLTTWPCFTEAMYLCNRSGGWPAQLALWKLVLAGAFELYTVLPDNVLRLQALMQQYRDNPMDLADASLVEAAESTGIHRVFTLDHHFHAYRIHGSHPFEVIA